MWGAPEKIELFVCKILGAFCLIDQGISKCPFTKFIKKLEKQTEGYQNKYKQQNKVQ